MARGGSPWCARERSDTSTGHVVCMCTGTGTANRVEGVAQLSCKGGCLARGRAIAMACVARSSAGVSANKDTRHENASRCGLPSRVGADLREFEARRHFSVRRASGSRRWWPELGGGCGRSAPWEAHRPRSHRLEAVVSRVAVRWALAAERRGTPHQPPPPPRALRQCTVRLAVRAVKNAPWP